MSLFSPVEESVVSPSAKCPNAVPGWERRDRTQSHADIISLGDGAAIKVLSGNLEQGSVAGYRTEIS